MIFASVWFQLVFGLFLFLVFILLRFWRLFVIVRATKTVEGQTYMIYAFVVFWSPAVLYGIICSALRADGPTYYKEIWMCYLATPATYTIFGIIGLYAVGIGVSQLFSSSGEIHPL